MRFFQQCLQLILQTDFVPRPLILCACECPPQSLFGIGHKAQSQLLGNQPLHQTFRVRKVFLAPASSAVGQCLRQMECSRHFPGTFPILTARFPVPFECAPQRFPVLGSGLHHHFLDSLLNEPLRQPLQLLRVASEPASLKLVCVVDFDVGHDYSQLLFVDVNSGYPIRHRLPPGGSGERAADYIKQGPGLSPLPPGGETTHHLFALSRTLRIRQSFGLSLSTVGSISPLRAIVDYGLALRNFHVISRAAGPR